MTSRLPMTKTEKERLDTPVMRVVAGWPAAPAWTAFIVLACAIPGSELPAVDIVAADKLVHIAVFFVLAVLWSIRNRPAPVALLIAGGVSLAVFTELMQGYLVAGRVADPFDALADVFGLLAGTAWMRTGGRFRGPGM